MASAKQIKARKLFALRSKRGDFRKGKKSSKKLEKQRVGKITKNYIQRERK